MPYSGKEPCPGCKKPGNENSRDSKNSLCWSCDKIYKLGQAKDKELSEEYVRVTSWPNNMASFNFDDRSLGNFLGRFLKIMDNPNAKYEETIRQPFHKHNIHGSRSHIIPKKLVEPLTEFFEEMNKFVYDLKEESENIPKKAREAVQEEKDRIYNEGIDKGRDLLMQLNGGDITQKDFEDNLTYRSREDKQAKAIEETLDWIKSTVPTVGNPKREEIVEMLEKLSK